MRSAPPATVGGNVLAARWLGRLPYREALALQDSLVRARRAGDVPDTILLLEHPPVITLGRSADPAHVLLSSAECRARGIEVHEVGRGGDVTYHGPGQLVGYPVLELVGARRDLHAYLRFLEEVLIDVAATYGIAGHRVPGLTGVWVGESKLAAIGVRVSTGWVTSHGFALNVASDLGGFAAIVPCGIAERGVTSLSKLAGRELSVEEVAVQVGERIGSTLGSGVVWEGRDERA